MTEPTDSPPPGWYPMPTGGTRWWDGAQFTEERPAEGERARQGPSDRADAGSPTYRCERCHRRSRTSHCSACNAYSAVERGAGSTVSPGFSRSRRRPGSGRNRGSGQTVVRSHPQGTTILVLGICGLLLCTPLGLVALIMGNSARAEMNATSYVWTNRSQIETGRILGIISTAMLGGLLALVVLTTLA